MAKKKKKRRSVPKPRSSGPGRLLDGLQEADRLMRKKRWAEARDLLEELDRRYPRRPEVLTDLVNVCYELQDTERYQYACERLLKVDPGNADATLGLAGAYMANLRPALALRAFRRFLERWPDDERAAEARETAAELEAEMPGLSKDLGISAEEGRQLAIQHEEMQVYLAQGRFRQVRQTAEAILRHYPNFAPAFNNLSLAHWAEGRIDDAVAAAQQVLSLEPDNVHALSNLVRFLCTSGRADEAQPVAEQLKASAAPAWDVWTKKAEALTYIGDDEGVLQVFHQAEQADESARSQENPLLPHLAAVAAMRLGHEDQARRYWRQAIKRSPGFWLAQENLADLSQLVGKRHAPWPFSLESWVGPKTLTDLVQFIAAAERKDDEEGVGRAARHFLRKHPEIVAVVPILLERGDERGRELALLLARTANTPELLEALKDFALSQHGPDQLRMEAAQVASQAGLLPPGPMRQWLEGEWREVLTMGFEIHGEPLIQYSPQVERWVQEASSALYEGDGLRAERALALALADDPEETSLLNNLAVAFRLQGRDEEADALIRQIHERHPDYLFARTGLAERHIERGELEEARQLLEPLTRRERMHYSEFDAFCGAYIQLYLAEDNVDAARSWFAMWKEVDPENPKLEIFRRFVAKSSRFAGLRNRFLGG
jgi:tetratricopeptide (TPR) repeat protein